MTALRPGARIKHYTLEERLGSGSSGEVWRANDGAQTVAIKFMNESLLTSKAAGHYRQQMEAEIDALYRLRHPNIPMLYDYDLEFKRPYLVMQFVDHVTYDRLIASGEILYTPLLRRLDVLRQIASAITATHELGIIHRDIKPSNITCGEIPYLLDFSIASDTDDPTAHPNVGTAIYMPPLESALDELSDNYSFAVVAYEMLFGRHPIFTPENIGRTVITTRRMTQLRLKNNRWRIPSQLPEDEIPTDLRGADLAKLDKIFESAFERRCVDLMQFVNDLREAILAPANLPYLMKGAVAPLPPERANDQMTNLDARRPFFRRFDPLTLAAVSLSLLTFIIWLLLFSVQMRG
jgi:serine/threonine protein kinase